MTIRSEGQFNTVVYEEEDLYRNQTRRDIVLMHPDDISRARPAGRRPLSDHEHGRHDAKPDRLGLRSDPAGQRGDASPREQRARAEGR